MAILATYNGGEKPLKKCYIKPYHIWGSKKDGWSAFIGVYKKATDDMHVANFSVSTPYVDGESPFPGLYAAIEQLQFITDIVHDKVEVVNGFQVSEQDKQLIKDGGFIEEQPLTSKKRSKKKNIAQ